ncbi:helix-turn-helix domain-containing protein, partial [Streptomyces minutiscleroticus]|uniref:helix-turn-helix domain-containing protein n=1 Tax=Streptomyces minutiscleroticus TaxID=68238 RepID=UPI003318AC24
MTRQASSPLPSPESARLVLLLRQLRERTGLSLAGLAEATTFSKSSWERYLNGRILPPRGAVKELCRLAGEPDGRCLALWEIARAEWGGRAKEATRAPSAGAGASAPAPAPAPARRPGPAAVVPDLGFVVHLGSPSSPIAYYQ